MAVIREELVLVDRFSNVFSQYLQMGRQMVELLERLRTSQGGYDETLRGGIRSLEDLAGSGRRTNEILEQMSDVLRELRNRTDAASNGQERANRSFRDGSSAAGGLAGKLRALAAAYLSLRSVQKLIALSDTWIQTTARLERMNDGLQTAAELQEMIFQAAQRSRGSYQDTANLVAKLGTLAGEAFEGPEEVVAFAEQINKQFALAGTSTQGAQAAMLQLTQAMGSGVLRGEELNSILEQAPTITKAIADYLDVSVGEMRTLASEGQITADVVKAAMFAAAEETNRAFEAVPLTFAQAWTLVKNEALNALRPALEQLNALLNSDVGQAAVNGLIAAVQMLGDALVWLIGLVEAGAAFLMENWETVSAVLIGGAVAVGGSMAAAAVKSAIAWAAANPVLLLIAGSVALVIFMARQMGASWADVCGFVGGVLYELYAFGYNLIANIWNALAAFAEFFANFLNDPIGSIGRLVFNAFDWILGLVEDTARAIDALFGKNFTSAVSGFRDNIRRFSADAFGEAEIKISRMEHIDYGEAWRKGSEAGRSIGAAIDSFSIKDYLSDIGGGGFDYGAMLFGSGIPDTLQEIGADTKAIKNAVALSEEDLKMLVDMAEREYVNNINLTAQTPIINISGQNTGDTEMDRQFLADAIRDILLEQAASHTDLHYT